MGKNPLSLKQHINKDVVFIMQKGELIMTEAIKAMKRGNAGSSDSKKLRASGKIPGIVYGHHSDPKSIALELRDVERLLTHHGIGAAIDLDIEGDKVFAMVKDVQRNAFQDRVLHLDLQELTKGETVKVSIPLHFLNKDKVEDSVMIVVEQVHTVDIEVLPKDLIESFDVDVSVLKDQASITMAELDIFSDDRYNVFADADTVIASLTQGGTKEPVAEESDEIESFGMEVVDKAEETEE